MVIAKIIKIIWLKIKLSKGAKVYIISASHSGLAEIEGLFTLRVTPVREMNDNGYVFASSRTNYVHFMVPMYTVVEVVVGECMDWA